MSYFTQKDHDWFQRVQEMPKEYMIAIANDGIWVYDIIKEECVYRFTSCGHCFIHALLNDIGISAEYY